jgi:hypothetical protein
VIFFTLAMTALVFPGGVQPGAAPILGALLGALIVFGTAWAVNNLDRNDLAAPPASPCGGSPHGSGGGRQLESTRARYSSASR